MNRGFAIFPFILALFAAGCTAIPGFDAVSSRAVERVEDVNDRVIPALFTERDRIERNVCRLPYTALVRNACTSETYRDEFERICGLKVNCSGSEATAAIAAALGDVPE